MKLSLAGFLLTVIPGTAVAQAAPTQWHLSAQPTLIIGGEGNPRTRLLRVGRVMRLPGGEIVVPNAGTNEIRIFDKTGRFLRALGRAGAGPGEFKSLLLVDRTGDTLFLADRVNRRITLFAVDGTLLATTPVVARDAFGAFSVVGRLRNGRWLVRTTSSPSLSGPQRTFRDTARIGALDPDASSAVTWLTWIPGTTYFVHNPANGPEGDVAAVVPLSPAAMAVALGNDVVIGDSQDKVIGAYADTGAVLRLITLPLEPHPLTDQKIAQLRTRALHQNPAVRSRPWLTALYSRDVMGRTPVVFGDLVGAADGSLWIQAGPADPTESATWLVLDAAGKPRATLVTPVGFRITEVGARYVLGVHTDADGMETVRLYQLTPQ
ncbi:MAG TPA: 6-bladed beta-propeller [Gemmatimonadales bacterium]|nr:6-bladed beta-propeller [Gemmatimonadales bacterium]